MRQDFTFQSGETTCAAWLYHPTTEEPTPCVVMAHGLSAVRDQRLDAYAERFAQAGMTVLLFDYRHFGDSGGEPRQLLSIHRQLQDWTAAITAARDIPSVDADRLALFGSSFSGGHVQVIAARDPAIAAVISQVPFCDGVPQVISLRPVKIMQFTGAGLKDLARAALGQAPYYLPVAGEPGTLAFLAEAEALPGFAKITPSDSPWRNEICARFGLTVGLYRPGRKAAQIRCPILYCIAEQDPVTPARFAHEAAARASQAEVKQYPCRHFDVYTEPFWEQCVTDQVDFLHRHLPVRIR